MDHRENSYLKIKNKRNSIAIIHVYAPTANADKTELNNFYTHLDSIYEKQIEYYIILLGDWNAKVSVDLPARKRLRNFCINTTNENRERVVHLVDKDNLKITNTILYEGQ